MSVVNAKCPNCGASIQLDNERTEGFCSYCGSKVKVEEAQKLLIQGTVKVDTSDELENLYQIARRAKESNNSESAYKYYDMILVKDPNSWEATFYVSYYQAMQCKIGEISSAAHSLCNSENSVLELIKKYVDKDEEQNKSLSEIHLRLSVISSMLFTAAKNHYINIDYQIQDQYLQEYIYRAAASADIMYTLGNLIISKFGDEFGFLASLAWQDGIEIHKEYVKYLLDKEGNVKTIEDYVLKIQKFDVTYQRPEIETNLPSSDGGCYIATSIYGSYDCSEVWILRRFRDNTLNNFLLGKWFIKTYYTISPTLVKWFGNSMIFKRTFTPMLNKLVSKLRNKGFSDSPYQDKK